MTSVASSVMSRLYGRNIWEEFVPGQGAGDLQGWYGNHPALTRLARQAKPHVAIDVGVWKGQSTMTLARAMKEAGLDGCVIAVDTFLGSSEHWLGRAKGLYRRTAGFPDLYWTFLHNVSRAGLTDYIVPMPQTSAAAAVILAQLDVRAGVVHIDASHDYADVLRDAVDYWNLLEPGGFLIGDDYADFWPGVVRAAGEFSARVGKTLAVEPPKWILRK